MARGVEIVLKIFPKSTTLVKLAKRTFHDPAFGQNSKLMQFAAPDNLHIGSNGFLNSFGKGFASIPAIAKNIHNTRQSRAIVFQHPQGTSFVRNISGRYMDCTWQPIYIHRDMALDSGTLFACIIGVSIEV